MRNFPLAPFACKAENCPMQRKELQREYASDEILNDLAGLTVRYWEGKYADELLKLFFPVEANMTLDFNLGD